MTTVDDTTTTDESTEGTAAPRAKRRTSMQKMKDEVRAAAIDARDSMGWDAEHLDATLIKLGCEPLHPLEVRIPFTVTETAVLAGNEGDTPEALIERAKASHARAYYAMTSKMYDSWDVTYGEPEVIDKSAHVEAEADPAALGDDVDAYKRLVRKVAIGVATERGWCDEGVNKYLRKLKVPEKRAIRVPVEVAETRMTYVVVNDAYDEAEATARMTSEPEALAEAFRTTHGGSAGHVELHRVLSLDDLRPGAADVMYGTADRYCEQRPRRARDRYTYCTRQYGHGGQHIAGNGTTILATWLEGQHQAFDRDHMPPEGWTVESGIPEGFGPPAPVEGDPISSLGVGDDADLVHVERRFATGQRYGQEGHCRERWDSYHCSRAPGHVGNHVACTGMSVVSIMAQSGVLIASEV